MKTKITLVLFLLVLIGRLYASSQSEANTFERSSRPGMGFYQFEDQEIEEYSGTLELVNGNPPLLNVASKKYSLMVPYHLLYGLDIQDGEDVTVKGYITPSHMWQWDDTEMSLYVTQATIKGEVYDLDENFGFGMRRRSLNRGMRRSFGCW